MEIYGLLWANKLSIDPLKISLVTISNFILILIFKKVCEKHRKRMNFYWVNSLLVINSLKQFSEWTLLYARCTNFSLGVNSSHKFCLQEQFKYFKLGTNYSYTKSLCVHSTLSMLRL